MKVNEVFKGNIVRHKENGALYVLADDYAPYIGMIKEMDDELEEVEEAYTSMEVKSNYRFELVAERNIVIQKSFTSDKQRVNFKIHLMISDSYAHCFSDKTFDYILETVEDTVDTTEDAVDDWLQMSLIKFTSEEWEKIKEELVTEEE